MSVDEPFRSKNGQFFGNTQKNRLKNLNSCNSAENVKISQTNEPMIVENDIFNQDKLGNLEPRPPGLPRTTNSNWQEGRRIIELSLLAEELKGCKNCSTPLLLHHCVGENRYGLGSILYVPCRKCSHVNHVHTGKRHRDESKKAKNGMLIWDMNTKLSLAYLDAGMGPHQTVNFLAAMNIPPIAVKNLKEREREIGRTLENCTELSCQKALNEEIALSRQENGNLPPTITVSFDGAWQKRGSGRSYSSLTGHATMIGEQTGKCISKGTKSLDCRKCKFVDEKGDSSHDCRKNHTGSAKAMESELAVEMVQDLECKGCRVSCIIMDDDTTTFARLKQSVNFDIQKRSDKNHQRKNIVSDLYKLHEKHKSKLSTTVINYLTKDLDYAIAQNRNNAAGLLQNIKAIVPHSFGDHNLCDSWCTYHKDPTNYKHKSLPYGKDLTDQELLKDLTKLFETYASNAEKLALSGSSQGNESLNQIISLKAPKAKHFGSSESLPFRVCAGVIQKNEGRSYIPQVYEAHNLSPGKLTLKHVRNIDKKRQRNKEESSTRESKRKRLDRKGKFHLKIKSQEVKEGTTYLSSVASTDVADDDIERIPDPIPSIEVENVPVTEKAYVFFDLETTGFGIDCDIIQLAAVHGESSFNRYMVPPQRISPSASKVTGFSKTGMVLYKNGEIIPTDEKSEVFKEFVSWLPDNSILIGHNAKAFDSRLLIKALQLENIVAEFEQKCCGFVDTLLLLKAFLPERKKENKSYKQEALVKDILGIEYDAHNAVGDVNSLKSLMISLNVPDKIMKQYSFSPDPFVVVS